MGITIIMIRVAIAAAIFAFTTGLCWSTCRIDFNLNFYSAENCALYNHVLEMKNVSSAVICGRDCFMDTKCASFNYHASSHLCELNNAARLHVANDSFVELQGSAYFDSDVNTSSLSVPFEEKYSNCQKLLKAGYSDNTTYTIYPPGMADGLQVYCDMKTDGGGWIVFQRRQDGSVDFYRNWTEYQSGFGDLSGEFWLGNEALRILTETGQWQLRVDLGDWEGNTAWAEYGEFSITGDKYTLHVGSYNGMSTAGDAIKGDPGDQPFSTKDQKNDMLQVTFAHTLKGAWWFTGMLISHLNGMYHMSSTVNNANEGIMWFYWKGDGYSLKQCSMKIKELQ
ncbi:microfibril-associated glycoprotein 4-like [Patiria miniata]|uniref:Fibrinogen C-terminal domain-containing protein n=1 Tax=Patiria miniata TaxID=46514 RepID=A0A914AF85_PATMI|nr:microfibril-associated glycoprotein 4-like [Patiria miniata]